MSFGISVSSSQPEAGGAAQAKLVAGCSISRRLINTGEACNTMVRGQWDTGVGQTPISKVLKLASPKGEVTYRYSY